MAMTIRQADPTLDLARIAEILSLYEPGPVTVDQLRELEQRQLAGETRTSLVAVSDDGQILGYATAHHGHWMGVGRFYLWVAVDPAAQGQGIGAQLYDRALALALEQGAAVIDSEVREQDEASMRFAQQRGFTVHRHMLELQIDLASFDESAFADVAESVTASGIRLVSLADMEDQDTYRRRFSEVHRRSALDNPAPSVTFATYEDFGQGEFSSSWFDPRGQIMALDQDEVIGIATVTRVETGQAARNLMTGVDPRYRGRKIAQALKLQAIRYARELGATALQTQNDAENVAILAINRKLGYQPRPGRYRLVKQVTP